MSTRNLEDELYENHTFNEEMQGMGAIILYDEDFCTYKLPLTQNTPEKISEKKLIFSPEETYTLTVESTFPTPYGTPAKDSISHKISLEENQKHICEVMRPKIICSPDEEHIAVYSSDFKNIYKLSIYNIYTGEEKTIAENCGTNRDLLRCQWSLSGNELWFLEMDEEYPEQRRLSKFNAYGQKQTMSRMNYKDFCISGDRIIGYKENEHRLKIDNKKHNNYKNYRLDEPSFGRKGTILLPLPDEETLATITNKLTVYGLKQVTMYESFEVDKQFKEPIKGITLDPNTNHIAILEPRRKKLHLETINPPLTLDAMIHDEVYDLSNIQLPLEPEIQWISDE